MPAGFVQHLAHRPQRLRFAAADRARARDLRPELRHLDVMRNVFQLAADDVGDQDVDGVGTDVQSGQTRHCSSLESGRGQEDAGGARFDGRDAGSR